MELSRIQGSMQDAAFFYIPIPSNLIPEGIAVYIVKSILGELKSEITDENGNTLTDENNNKITFDNSKLYPEMPLFLWRGRIVNGYVEQQVVFLHKYAD